MVCLLYLRIIGKYKDHGSAKLIKAKNNSRVVNPLSANPKKWSLWDLHKVKGSPLNFTSNMERN